MLCTFSFSFFKVCIYINDTHFAYFVLVFLVSSDITLVLYRIEASDVMHVLLEV